METLTALAVAALFLAAVAGLAWVSLREDRPNGSRRGRGAS